MKEIIIDGVTYICTPKEEKAVKKVEHEYVDLGLPSGRLWATCNIGAEKPTDCGYYFAFCEVKPYDMNYCGINDLYFDKEADLTEIDDKYDAAKKLWGGDWRMPTFTDFSELMDNCTYNSEVIDGIMCGVFASKVNSQKIIIPAAGNIFGGGLFCFSKYGIYRSRSFRSYGNALALHFDSDVRGVAPCTRYYGLPVRPVRS